MRRFVPLLALVAIAGCENGVGPRLQGEVYSLESIAGISLPAPYAENPAFTQRIIWDSIAFGANGKGQRRTRYEGDPDPAKTYTVDVAFSFTKAGDRIEIVFECPDGALCIAGPHLAGTISEIRMTITESRISRQPLVYGRFLPD